MNHNNYINLVWISLKNYPNSHKSHEEMKNYCIKNKIKLDNIFSIILIVAKILPLIPKMSLIIWKIKK